MLTAVAVVVFRRAVCAIHKTVFKFDQGTAMLSIQKHLASYKLLSTVFNFTPWLALLIIKH